MVLHNKIERVTVLILPGRCEDALQNGLFTLYVYFVCSQAKTSAHTNMITRLTYTTQQLINN